MDTACEDYNSVIYYLYCLPTIFAHCTNVNILNDKEWTPRDVNCLEIALQVLLQSCVVQSLGYAF